MTNEAKRVELRDMAHEARHSWSIAHHAFINALTLKQYQKLPVGDSYFDMYDAVCKTSKSKKIRALAIAATVRLQDWLKWDNEYDHFLAKAVLQPALTVVGGHGFSILDRACYRISKRLPTKSKAVLTLI